MNLLAIAQQVADEIGIDRPATVVGNTDLGVRQLLALLNREGYWLVNGGGHGHRWGASLRDKSVTVTSGTDTYAVPTDFLKMVNDSMWDTTNHWQMIGPVTSQEWEEIKRGAIATTGPRKRWRLIGEADGTYAASATAYYVQIDPSPTNSSDTFFYEYISNGFARQNSDAAAGIFDHDSDVPILPEQLFILGGIWRWKAAKGLDYVEDKRTYDQALETYIATDRAARKLSMSRVRSGPRLLDLSNVPDSGFGD
jgi:hypothetical protein